MTLEEIKTPGDLIRYIDIEILVMNKNKCLLPKIRKAVNRLYGNDNSLSTYDFMDQVIHVVCLLVGTEPKSLIAKNRKHELSFSRQLIWYILSLNTNKSLSVLGRIFNRDHATALHGIKTISDYIDSKNVETIYTLQQAKIMFNNLGKKIDNGL